MQTNLITTAEFEEVSFDHVDFVVALSVKEEMSAYETGLVDAKDGEPFAPEMMWVKPVDMLNYSLGFLEVRPDCQPASAMADSITAEFEMDAHLERENMRRQMALAW